MKRQRAGALAVAGGTTVLWLLSVAASDRWVSLVLGLLVLVVTYLTIRAAYEAGWIDGIRGERR